MNLYQEQAIQIVDYDPAWPAQFDEEAKLLARLLKVPPTSIHHIGSTSVPQLSSKPLVDILVTCSPLRDREYYDPLMKKLEFTYRPVNDEDRLFYEKKKGTRYHVHLVESDSWHHWRLILFRDRLRRDSKLASEYVALKKRLAEAFAENRDNYSRNKTDFVTSAVLDEINTNSELRRRLEQNPSVMKVLERFTI